MGGSIRVVVAEPTPVPAKPGVRADGLHIVVSTQGAGGRADLHVDIVALHKSVVEVTLTFISPFTRFDQAVEADLVARVAGRLADRAADDGG